MMYNNIMNTIEYSFKFPIQVLSDRITIALSNLGLNEFYAAFKYLRDILKNILEKKDDSNESIKDSVTIVQNKYGITFAQSKVVINMHFFSTFSLNYLHISIKSIIFAANFENI